MHAFFSRFVIAVLTTACTVSPTLAQDELPHYLAHRVETKITVDGKLDEPAWNEAPTFGTFQFPWWKSGAQEQTTARLLWDRKFLYVAFECDDAHISAKNTERDSPVYEDDCVEFFTAPDAARPNNYFNIEMNVNRGILDRHHPDGPGKSEVPNWNAQGIRIATTVDGTLNDDSDTDRGWVLEVAIPFANFASVTGRSHPQDGDVWRVNLNRCGGETNPQYSQWSRGKTEAPAFHTPATFGRVTFSRRTSREHAHDLLSVAGYEAVPGFLKLPPGVTVGACSAVATSRRGEVYLFHRGKQPILCFDRKGEFIRSWGDKLIGRAHGLRIDRDGNVWATDIDNHMVFKFSPTGKLLLALGRSGKPGTERDQFNKPTDVAFGPDGEVFVSDGYGNSRVVKFDRQGKFLTAWGTSGNGRGSFDLPHAIVVDSKGRVLVGDRENDRIQVFDLDGRFQDMWQGFAPFGIALDSAGRIFVADGRANQILILDANGREVHRFGGKGSGPGQFNLPHMLGVGQDSSLFVAEVGGKRLQKFRPIRRR